jgi:hypothetical protein
MLEEVWENNSMKQGTFLKGGIGKHKKESMYSFSGDVEEGRCR